MKRKILIEIGNPGNTFHQEMQSGRYELKQNMYRLKLKYWDEIYYISFGRDKNEDYKFDERIKILYNKNAYHSLIYAFLIPWLYRDVLSEASVFMPKQLSCSLYGIYSKLFFRKKVVVHCGYNWQEPQRHAGKPWYYKAFVNFWCFITYKFSDAVIVTSDRHLKHAEMMTGKKNVFLLRNGVNTDLFKNLKIQRNSSTVLFVGRLEKEKNLFNLITATTLTKNKIILKIAGRGSLEKELKDHSAKLNAPVEFLGPLETGQLINNFYNRETMFVLPSFFEGHSNALTEAMACGIPVIVSEAEGNTEIIKHEVNGLVSGFTPEKMAECIDRYISNPDLKNRMAENALAEVEENYNLKKRIEREIEILKKFSVEKL